MDYCLLPPNPHFGRRPFSQACVYVFQLRAQRWSEIVQGLSIYINRTTLKMELFSVFDVESLNLWNMVLLNHFRVLTAGLVKYSHGCQGADGQHSQPGLKTEES